MTDWAKEKAVEERAEFERFARAAGLPVVTGSVACRRPPEPDILCEVDGRGPVAFELVQVIPGLLANPRSKPGWYADPTLHSIGKHLRGDYRTPHPMELVAYADPHGLEPRDVWEPKYQDRLRQMLSDSPFRALWVFVRNAERIWRPPSAEIWFSEQR